MAQKIRPDSLRLGIIKDWKSRWFGRKSYKSRLEEDLLIRKLVEQKIKQAGIVSVDIERNANNAYKIIIKAARPGLIIGRGGQGIEELSKFLRGKLEGLKKSRGESKPQINLSVNIEELKRTEIAAQNVAQQLAFDIERRLPFRRSMKKIIENSMQNRDVQGIKVRVSGRLNGADIARSETLSKGKLPLQTLRANIDYGQATANTTYGSIGIKVWVYKGLVFSKETNKNERI
ncbi:MAG: 30S ribosomal protein S3 [bacterium]|nr:30S ribosomal protein S3 [bacterium]